MFVLSFACEFCVSLLRGRRELPLGALVPDCFRVFVFVWVLWLWLYLCLCFLCLYFW